MRVYDGSGHPENGSQGRASAGFAGRRSLTAGFSLHPLHTVKKDGFSAIFFYRKLTKQSSLTAGFQVHLNFRCNSGHFYSEFRPFSLIPL